MFKGLIMDPWFIPIITWCWQFPSLSTNILLIKSKLKLESRAIVVGVAMSPRNLGGKYRCRPHPRWRKCTRQFFFPEPERVNRTASEWRRRLHGDNIIDHVVCLKAEFMWHTVFSIENGEFYTYDIYPYLNRSVCLLMGSPTWWRFYLLFKQEFPRVLMTWRTARARISNESVETGDESVETRDESIEAGEKTQQSCYNYNLIRVNSKWWKSISVDPVDILDIQLMSNIRISA